MNRLPSLRPRDPTRQADAEIAALLAAHPHSDVRELSRLLQRRYPPVAYGIEDPGYLPVLVFHSVTERGLVPKLEYLRANGYHTVSLDEAVAWMERRGRLPARAVALTLDDGRRSTWSVAAPLLEKYAMQATAYVVPGYLEEGPLRPTLTDVWRGGARRDDVELPEREDALQFMRWSEAEALQRGGTIAIHSHSMLHRRVFARPGLRGFLAPGDGLLPFNLPQHPAERRAWTRAAAAAAAGSPLFAAQPLLALPRAWIAGETFRRLCLARVADEGAEGFFARPGWQRELRRLERLARRDEPQWMDLSDEHRWELETSFDALRERLPRAGGLHFCAPNSSALGAIPRLACAAGYASSAWGLLDHRVTNRQGCDPQLLARIKHDFVVTLPGEGRRSLAEVLKHKVLRRLRGERGY